MFFLKQKRIFRLQLSLFIADVIRIRNGTLRDSGAGEDVELKVLKKGIVELLL